MNALARGNVAALAGAAYPKGLAAVNDNPKPTPNELHMAQLLGELTGELRGIKATLDDMRGDIDQASESRSQLHEKLGLIDTRLQKVESTVTVMGGVVDKQTRRVDKIEPIALWLIMIASGLLLVGGALWYGILNFGAQAIEWLHGILPKS